MTFGERLAYLRESQKLTQVELANLTLISRSRLSLYETDKREPDLQTVKQLADFFGVTTDYLLGRLDNSPVHALSTAPSTNRDLIKFLEQPEITFDGLPLTDDDKEKIKKALELVFWETKQQNKRQKS